MYTLFQDTITECMRRCQLELEELQKHQSERVQLLLQQNEEKEQKLREENERALAALMEENKAKEALMIAKHEEEKRAARKAKELEAERYAPSAPSHPPCIPECPVGFHFSFMTLSQNNQFHFYLARCAWKR